MKIDVTGSQDLLADHQQALSELPFFGDLAIRDIVSVPDPPDKEPLPAISRTQSVPAPDVGSPRATTPHPRSRAGSQRTLLPNQPVVLPIHPASVVTDPPQVLDIPQESPKPENYG